MMINFQFFLMEWFPIISIVIILAGLWVFYLQTQNIIVRLENITKSIDMAGVEITDSIDEVTDSIDKAIAEIVAKNKNGLG